MLKPGWQKSSMSNPSGNCVEIGLWKTALLSQGTSNCVEIGAWSKASLSFANANCVEVGAWSTASKSFANHNCVEIGAWSTSEMSSHNGGCVEVGAWNKAGASLMVNDCVETMADDEAMVILVRDTKDRSIAPVAFGLGVWVEFVARCNAGEFPVTDADTYRIAHLAYTRTEWECFLDGCAKQEFDLPAELAALI